MVTVVVRGPSLQSSLLHYAANQGNRIKTKVQLNVKVGESILVAVCGHGNVTFG